MRDFKSEQPPPPPPVKGAVPLFNPNEIQLGRKEAFPKEKKNSSSAQRENPFRKETKGMDC